LQRDAAASIADRRCKRAARRQPIGRSHRKSVTPAGIAEKVPRSPRFGMTLALIQANVGDGTHVSTEPFSIWLSTPAST
jgi:hypothetical protein